MKQINPKKGFTLVELLIASTIFATVMMLALSTFAWAANYNTKLKQIRYVTGDGKHVISEISKDIRLANGSVNFVDPYLGNVDLGEATLVICASNASDATKINCLITGYNLVDVVPVQEEDATYDPDHKTCGTNASGTEICWNGILVLNKNQNQSIIYYSSQEGSNFLTRKGVLGNLPNVAADLQSISSDKFIILNDENKTSVKVDFYGKLYGKDGRKLQPYLRVEVNSRSKDSDDIEAKSKFEFQFETLIETRDYSAV